MNKRIKTANLKKALQLNWILVSLLSIATGIFKLLRQEADIQLFEAIGFSETMVFLLGALQLLGGILLIIPKTRRLGAYIMIPTFVIAAVAVFMNHMFVFGLISLLFIMMAFGVVVLENKY